MGKIQRSIFWVIKVICNVKEKFSTKKYKSLFSLEDFLTLRYLLKMEITYKNLFTIVYQINLIIFNNKNKSQKIIL